MVHRNRLKYSLFVLSAFLILSVFTNTKSGAAQSESLVLEVEQHWETFGVGGTCIGGGHNLVVADVDGDGVKEMITGGSSYYSMQNGSRGSRWAPLKIWNWNGQNITLEKGYNWDGNIRCIYVDDADGDGKQEIITAGSMTNSTGSYPSLRVWTWDGETLVLRGSYEGETIGSVCVCDGDGDGKPEIITVPGRYADDIQSVAKLSIFRWDGINLTLIKSVDCCDTKDARAYSVYAYDLDNDGVTEIVTAGYGNDLKNSVGQLRVWHFDGTDLSLKYNVEWCMIEGVYSVDVAGNVMGNTLVSNVKVADVDGDGFPEIVTGGFTYDGTKVVGQIRIWNWSGEVLNLEKSHEWVNLDITQPTAVSINDVDADGRKEIVTSGFTAGYGSFAVDTEDKSRAELKVWSWDGNTLTLKQSKDWIVGGAVSAWNVGTGDVDNDGVEEIVTVGCMQTINLRDCDPDLRIWSISSVPSASFPYLIVAIIGVSIAVVAVMGAAFLFARKKLPKS